jgi:hypothetical protein
METKRIPKRKKKKEETNPTVYQYSGITTLGKINTEEMIEF